MMIETLISMARYLSARKDDDIADRMNYLYTPNMLLAFSVLISFKQFGGRPLECMFPNKFPGSWEQYAENFCWSEDTYYLPPEVHVAQILESERYSAERKLSYYQWVPFFLLIQAACFRLPSLIWKATNLSSGVRVHDIVLKAQDSQNMEEENRRRTMQLLSNHLSRALRFQNQILRRHLIVHKTLRFLNITYSACFVSFMYLVTKFLYLGNVLMQLYLMNKFLETDRYQWYGLSVIKDIMAGIPWQASGYFPRVSLCDFTVRQVANIQKYSVQCVLVINIFNEKIFILLWFWYALLLVATLLSIVYWSTLMFFPLFGRWYIAQALELHRMDPNGVHRPLDAHAVKKERKNVVRFVNEFLKNDGVFTLRMLGLHIGILFTSELVAELYQVYEQLLENNGQTFSEDTTLKLEDGTLVAKFQSPAKKVAKQKTPTIVVGNSYDSYKGKGPTTKQQQQNTKQSAKKRAGSAPAASDLNDDDNDDENNNLSSVVTTSLIPLAMAAGNKKLSSTESSSSEVEDEDQQQDIDDGNGDKQQQQRQKKRR